MLHSRALDEPDLNPEIYLKIVTAKKTETRKTSPRGRPQAPATAAAILGRPMAKAATVAAPKKIKHEWQKYYYHLLELREQLLAQIQQPLAILLPLRFDLFGVGGDFGFYHRPAQNCCRAGKRCFGNCFFLYGHKFIISFVSSRAREFSRAEQICHKNIWKFSCTFPTVGFRCPCGCR